MSFVARGLRPFLVLVALSAAASPLTAQTHDWTGGAGSGSWAAAGNWNPSGVPSPSSGTILNLAGTTQTATIQDISPGTPFDLNRLVMTDTATSGFTVGGGPLRFAGTSPTIQVDAAALLRINSAITFSLPTTALLNANNLTGQELILGGALTAAPGAGLTVGGGTGTGLTITSANNTNFSGTLSFASGSPSFVSLGAVNAVGRGAILDLSNSGGTIRLGTTTGTGPGFVDAGYSQQVGRIVGTVATGSQIQIGAGTLPATLLAGFDGASSTFTGVLANSVSGSHFGKVGAGTLTLTANSGAYNGTVSVRDGVLSLEGGSGKLGASNTAMTVYGGGTLRLNNATLNQDRLPGTGTVAGTPVTLAGGSLEMLGHATSNTSENMGGLRLASGESLVTITPGAGASRFSTADANLSAAIAQLAGSPTATLFVRGNNLGLASSGTGAATAGINLNDSARTIGGIIPYIVGSTSSTGGPTSFVGYDATNSSLRPLQAGDYTTFALSTATSNVSDGGFTVAVTGTVNALRTTGNVTLTGTLTVTSGALLNTNAGTQITGAGGLSFGLSGPVTAFITTPADLTLATPVSAANFAKSGAGTLTLSSTVTLNGSGERRVSVNSGTLAVAAGGGFATTQAVTFDVSRGATLDVAGAGGLTLTANRTLRGGGTVAGPTTVGSTGAIIPSALAGPGTTLASPDTLTTGNLIFQGGGEFRVYMSSVLAGRDTISTINSTGSLDLTGLTSATPFTVRLDTLALSNADITTAVYDFDPNAGYAWTILTTAGGVNGFDADKFNLVTTDFGTVTGTFSLTQSGNDLVVVYNPVPEPAAIGLVAAALLAARRLRRGFRAAA